jgi:hypothetical protein
MSESRISLGTDRSFWRNHYRAAQVTCVAISGIACGATSESILLRLRDVGAKRSTTCIKTELDSCAPRDQEQESPTSDQPSTEETQPSHRRAAPSVLVSDYLIAIVRMTWSLLLARVFAPDIARCHSCSQPLQPENFELVVEQTARSPVTAPPLPSAYDQATLDDILDPKKFANKWSEGVFYNFSELFVATIIDHFGPNAPLELFRVIADSAGALDDWPAAFARAGLNFGDLARRFREHLMELVALHDRSIRSIPDYLLRVEKSNDGVAMLKVETRHQSPSSLEMTCRFRAPGGSSEMIEALDLGSQSCTVPRHLVKGQTVEVGLTISADGKSMYHSAWQSLGIP